MPMSIRTPRARSSTPDCEWISYRWTLRARPRSSATSSTTRWPAGLARSPPASRRARNKRSVSGVTCTCTTLWRWVLPSTRAWRDGSRRGSSWARAGRPDARPALRTAAWRTSSTRNASSHCSSSDYAPHPDDMARAATSRHSPRRCPAWRRTPCGTVSESSGFSRPRGAQRLHPVGDGPPDLVRRIFLEVMDSRDLHLGLRWQASGEVENRAAGEDPTRFGLHEQLGHTARRREPVRVGGCDRSHVGGLAVDGDLPGPCQCRSSPLAGLGEWPSVLRHLLGGEGS